MRVAAVLSLPVLSAIGAVRPVPSRVRARSAAATDSVIVRVTSEDGVAPATFEARYLLVGSDLAPGAPTGGVVTSRQTPYTLALPVTHFQGVFRQVGSARIHVQLVVRHDGQTLGSATAVAPVTLIVADGKGTAGATGF